MTKIKIEETTEKYDENGKLVEKITREETIEDDTIYYPKYRNPWMPNIPNIIQPNKSGNPWEPYCTVTSQDTNNIKPV